MTTRFADAAWFQVVLWFVALNVLDLGLTLHLVARGAEELNPVMAWLLAAGWGWAAAFKCTATAAVAAGLWFGRRHLLVRRVGVAFLVLFALITAYQVMDVVVAQA